MRNWTQHLLAACVVFPSLVCATARGDTVSQVNFSGTGDFTNSFSGFIRYQTWSATPEEGDLTISLTNDYKPDREAGNITAFVFNIMGSTEYELLRPNPTDLDSNSPSFWWSLTSETQLTDSEPVNPYGRFEAGVGIGIGTSDTNNDAEFLGGGNGADTEGLMGGETGVFAFKVIGPNAGGLNAFDFITEGSTGTNKPQVFAVRYKGIGPGDQSNKALVGTTTVIPLPPAVWAGMSLFGMLGIMKARRLRMAAAM